MPSATFSLDGHDAPVREDLITLGAGDTETITWYIDGFESGDTVSSITMYAKVDPADADGHANTITVPGTITTPALNASAREVAFPLTSANTLALLRGRTYEIRAIVVRAAVTYQQVVAMGWIGAALPGSTAVAPSDEAYLRQQGDATQLAAAMAYADQQMADSFAVADITDIATADTGITSVGTLDTGVWQATPIAAQFLATISTPGKVANAATTATPLGVPSAIVARDASGDFVASTITANLQGNALTATRLSVARTFQLVGEVSGSVSSDLSSTVSITAQIVAGSIANGHVNVSAAIAYSKLNLAGSIVNADVHASAGIVDTKLATIATAGKVANSATTAVSTNTASAIVTRDASGNFAAGTITAALIGNASTASALQTSRTINGVSFDGSANITVAAAAGTLTGGTLSSGVTSSSLASVGVLTALNMSGAIMSTVAGAVIQRTGATTTHIYGQFVNDGCNMAWGAESAAGGQIFSGTAAYATVFGTSSAASLQLVTNNAVRLTIAAGGDAALSGAVSMLGGNYKAELAADASNVRLQTYTTRTLFINELGNPVRFGAAANLGFFGAAATAKPVVTGSRAGNPALASALTALATLGLWTDSTTA